MTRILTDMNVDEVSVVDKAAAPGARITIRKRDGKPDYERVFRKIFGVDEKPRKKWGYSPTRKDAASHLDVAMDTDADLPPKDAPVDVGNHHDDPPKHPLDIAVDVGDDDDGTSPRGKAALHLDGLAQTLVAASKGQLSKADALHWLLFTQPGRTMVHRLAALHKKDNQMNKYDPDFRDKVVRKYGLTNFCKSVSAGEINISEAELSGLVKRQAERENVSFEKLFSAPDVWKAVQAARDSNWVKAAQQLMPTAPTFVYETAEAVNDDNSESYRQLVDLAERMHAASPVKTVAQHFADIYQDPEAQAKARREIAATRNRAVPEPSSAPGLEKAYDQLVTQAEGLRKAHPELSEAQAFEKVYSAPANRELVKRERAENRPHA
jgi:hypothetical protein